METSGAAKCPSPSRLRWRGVDVGLPTLFCEIWKEREYESDIYEGKKGAAAGAVDVAAHGYFHGSQFTV